MIEVELKKTGVDKLLKKISKRAGALRPAMRLIGEIIHESVMTNFEVGGRYRYGRKSAGQPEFVGGPRKWAELHPRTIAERKKLGYWHSASNKGQILVRRGMQGGLMGSIAWQAYDDEVRIGANKKYDSDVDADTLHRGRKNLDGTRIPPRPFLVVQEDEDLPEMEATLEDYIFGRSI